MKVQKLEEIKIVCEPPRLPFYVRNKGMEAEADFFEEWVRDFHYFIKDHRSQDPVSLSVEREYVDVCSFCESEWDTDENGMPTCCQRAEDEFNSKKEAA